MAADFNAACARCGGGFHCGANDPAPCACTGLQLSATLLASLRQRHTGCLCLRCLRELAEAGAPHPRDNGHAPRE
ncbi:MAG TPA: cysteine-rich CWC family protein [Burkholderiaceae bacterium]|nr:cysteine-rich CWC family protein [Burkholderiaceae bacterium]